MGGELTVDSAPGEGSVFCFTARFRTPPDTQAPPSPPPELLPAPPAAPPPGLSVLVAEDNPVNQRRALTLLAKRGHRARLARDGAEAVAYCQREAFDLILMDVQMPVLDGLAAARAIRDRERTSGGRVPILAVTAHATADDCARCLAAGMDGHLVKPFRPEEFYRAVEETAGPLPARRARRQRKRAGRPAGPLPGAGPAGQLAQPSWRTTPASWPPGPRPGRGRRRGPGPGRPRPEGAGGHLRGPRPLPGRPGPGERRPRGDLAKAPACAPPWTPGWRSWPPSWVPWPPRPASGAPGHRRSRGLSWSHPPEPNQERE